MLSAAASGEALLLCEIVSQCALITALMMIL